MSTESKKENALILKTINFLNGLNVVKTLKHEYDLASVQVKLFAKIIEQREGSSEMQRAAIKWQKAIEETRSHNLESSEEIADGLKLTVTAKKSEIATAASEALEVEIANSGSEELQQAFKKFKQLSKFELSEKERKLERIERESKENDGKLKNLLGRIKEVLEFWYLIDHTKEGASASVEDKRLNELSKKFESFLREGVLEKANDLSKALFDHFEDLSLERDELEQKSLLLQAQNKFIQSDDPQDKMQEYQANLSLKILVAKQQSRSLSMEQNDLLQKLPSVCKSLEEKRAELGEAFEETAMTSFLRGNIRQLESEAEDIRKGSLKRREEQVRRGHDLVNCEILLNEKQQDLFGKILNSGNEKLMRSTIAWQEAIEKTRSQNLELGQEIVYDEKTVAAARLQWEQDLSVVNDPSVNAAKKEFDLAELQMGKLKIDIAAREFADEHILSLKKLKSAQEREAELTLTVTNSEAKTVDQIKAELDLAKKNVSEKLSDLPWAWRNFVTKRRVSRNRPYDLVNGANLEQGISDVEGRNEKGDEDDLLGKLRSLDVAKSGLNQLEERYNDSKKLEQALKAVKEAKEESELSWIQQQDNKRLSQAELRIFDCKIVLINSDDSSQKDHLEKEVKKAEVARELVIAQIEKEHVQRERSSPSVIATAKEKAVQSAIDLAKAKLDFLDSNNSEESQSRLRLAELKKEYHDAKLQEEILRKEFLDVGKDNQFLKNENELWLEKQKIVVAEKYLEYSEANNEIGQDEYDRKLRESRDYLANVRKESGSKIAEAHLQDARGHLDQKVGVRDLMVGGRDLLTQEQQSLNQEVSDEVRISSQAREENKERNQKSFKLAPTKLDRQEVEEKVHELDAVELRIGELERKYSKDSKDSERDLSWVVDGSEKRDGKKDEIVRDNREDLIDSWRRDKVDAVKRRLIEIDKLKPQELKELEAERDALFSKLTTATSLRLKINDEIDPRAILFEIAKRVNAREDRKLTITYLERVQGILETGISSENEGECSALLDRLPARLQRRLVSSDNQIYLPQLDQEIKSRKRSESSTRVSEDRVIKDLEKLLDSAKRCAEFEPGLGNSNNISQRQKELKENLAKTEGVIKDSFELSEDSCEYDLLVSKRKLLKLTKDSLSEDDVEEAQREVFAAQVKKDRVEASKKMFEAEFGNGDSLIDVRQESLIDVRQEFVVKYSEAQRELDSAVNAISPKDSNQETVAIDALAAAEKLKEFQQSSRIILSEDEKAARAQEVKESRDQQAQSVKALKAQNKIDSENGRLDELGLSELSKLGRTVYPYSREDIFINEDGDLVNSSGDEFQSRNKYTTRDPFKKAVGVEFIDREATSEEENKFDNLIAAGRLREAIIKKAEFEFDPNLLQSDGEWNQSLAAQQKVEQWKEFCEDLQIKPSYLARKSRQHSSDITIAQQRKEVAHIELEIVTLKEKLLGNEVEDGGSVRSDMGEEVVDERVINAQIKIKELEKEWFESKRVEAILQKEFDAVGNNDLPLEKDINFGNTDRALRDTNERFLKQQRIDAAEKYCAFKTAELQLKYDNWEISEEELIEAKSNLEKERNIIREKERSRERSSQEIEAEKVFLDSKLQENILRRDLLVQTEITKRFQEERLIIEKEIKLLQEGNKDASLREKDLRNLGIQIAKSAVELTQIELAVENKELDVAKKKNTYERMELKFKYDNGKINQDEFKQGLERLRISEEIYLEEPKKKRALEEKLQKTILEREGGLNQDQVRPYSRKEEGQDKQVISKSWKREVERLKSEEAPILGKEQNTLKKISWERGKRQTLEVFSSEEMLSESSANISSSALQKEGEVIPPLPITLFDIPQPRTSLKNPRAVKLFLIDPRNPGAAFEGDERSNKFRVAAFCYTSDREIAETMAAIICDAAKDAKLELKRATDVINFARKSGGVEHSYGEGSYKKNENLRLTEDIELTNDDKNFSGLFQQRCKECGIYSGRADDDNLHKPLVGLRTAFIPLEVLDLLQERKDVKPISTDKSLLKQKKEKVNNIRKYQIAESKTSRG